MVRRLFASAMVLLAVSGYISLGCRALPHMGSTPTSRQVHLAAVVTPATIPPTTTTTAPPPPPPPPTTPPRASRSLVRPRYAGPVTDATFAALARCEAGGRADAVSRSGRYFGAFQFSLATWQSMGMTGRPIDHPYEVQLATAKRLQMRSGWGQWPVCSRRLGLR